MKVSVKDARAGDISTPARVAIEGAMTIYESASGKALLLEALEAHPEIVFDISGVTEMDSAGLQLLVMIKREAHARGKSVRLEAHSPAVLEVLDCYRLAAYFGDAVVIPSSAHAQRAKPEAA